MFDLEEVDEEEEEEQEEEEQLQSGWSTGERWDSRALLCSSFQILPQEAKRFQLRPFFLQQSPT